MKRDEASSRRFVVLGAARSGVAAARLLKAHGADVILADSKSVEEAGSLAAEMDEAGIAAAWGDEAIRRVMPERDILVKSPGIPQSNSLVAAARKLGVRVISEIELAHAFLPAGAKLVAITGTNGKTTVTAWLAHVLAECGFHAVPAGNIGDAWSAQLLSFAEDAGNTVYVVEVSSFQLEDLEDFRPNVAILTNISPDHMDRYEDRMDLYVAAKGNIHRNMTGDDVFVWNGADEASLPVVEKCRADVRVFCASGELSPYGGAARAWADGGTVYYRSGDGNEPIALMQAGELPIPGKHNLENALAVASAAVALGSEPENVAEGLKTFAGVEHRIELCGRRGDGVAFYNDSKATNLDAMEKALVAFEQPIVLIAGGRDAHSDYGSIVHLVKKHVAGLVTIGEAAALIEEAWGGVVPTQRAETMQEAVALADGMAEAGQVVVFSPACKSFDMYGNFEERGIDFKEKVRGVLARDGREP